MHSKSQNLQKFNIGLFDSIEVLQVLLQYWDWLLHHVYKSDIVPYCTFFAVEFCRDI